ncbi:hypothetical protein F5J12DRAFT_952009 [Pisolithus orientalis]|uniref:uncharacterized protein n=1 Tax=Pisolithus orientalis TaxID=936130 RepID=UPI00222550F2|nr:uncharacterized protein F5J12DRAFT_952009 [Pisolithus orientalis]KAI5999859.1 hypothetical protein F5J12DRAFT_952009 [Pisolithus orientalis]
MAKAFSMLVGAATECGPFNISWTGGQSPFQIAIFTVSSSPVFHNVSSSAYQGSYTIPQLPLPQGLQFVVILSDATGFATGGTTYLITVGEPTSSSSCNTTLPSLSYYFSDVGFPLQQCGPFEFSGYQGAILPVTFVGIVPGGQSFLIQSGVTTTSYTWTADVQAGTSIMFSMWDANGNSGGCSVLQSVGPSNDASCLSSQTGSITSAKNIPVSTIAGIAVGVFTLAALVSFGLRVIQRRRRNASVYSSSMPPHPPPLHSADLVGLDILTTTHVYSRTYQSDRMLVY